jgi:transglutaminase-like putative cysteine protease
VVAIAQTARPRASIAEKFFQGSLYLLLVMGFCALAGTSRLDALSLVLVAFALLLRGYLLLRGRTTILAERWTSLLTLLYFVFYALDYFLLSQSFVNATVHMVLFIMVVKIFSVQRDRDYIYLAVLSFLMVLAAAVLTVDTVFLFTFCPFMLTAMSTFVSMEMRRSEREGRIIAVSPANENRFHRSLYAVAGLLAISTVAVGVVIFFILPRMTIGGYLQSLGGQTDFVSGFSESVNLGGIGRIQQSNAPVMHVQVLYGGLTPDTKWRGLALSDFDGRRWSNPGREQPLVLPMHNVPVDLRQLRLSDTPIYSVSRKETLAYRVIMEPIGSYVFFLASTPLQVNGPYSEVSVFANGSVNKNDETRSIDIYEGQADTSDPAPLLLHSKSLDYPPGVRTRYVGLPARLDQRIPALAKKVTSSAISNYARAKAIEDYLRKNLDYTLDLPGKEADPLAHFLFERKKGHCEYFASAMAIMLRTLNIPTRLVNGFRGAEYNDVNQTYIIRAQNAHSWVEVYFPEYGWVAFDPTPSLAVRPGSDVSSRFALYMDALHETWREWIINYDFNHQLRLGTQITAGAAHMQNRVRFWYTRKYNAIVGRMSRMRGTLNTGNTFVICALGLLLVLFPILPRVWRNFRKAKLLKNPQNAPRSSASLWYARMLKIMERRGIRKTPAQTAGEFALAIDDPEVQKGVLAFTEHYERARFGGSADDAMCLPKLCEELETITTR